MTTPSLVKNKVDGFWSMAFALTPPNGGIYPGLVSDVQYGIETKVWEPIRNSVWDLTWDELDEIAKQ